MDATPSNAQRQVIEADLTWTGGRFERGVRVVVEPDGLIGSVGPLSEKPTLRLAGRALLPGMVNAHSHAFQRGLRGRGETYPQGAGSFWTWRDAMYGLVSGMDETMLHALCVQAFGEMLAAGVTTVGEFHYLHHDESGMGFAFDEVVLRAARDAGIRIVLLESYYNSGGIGQPLAGGQLRFRTASMEEFWSQMDALAKRIDPRTQSLGVAPHSIRAATIEEIAAIFQEATRKHLVCHVHVEEQPKEIEDCLEAYHKTPMALLNERLTITPRFTAIHCTHTAAADLEAFVAAGGNVCLCPLTEGSLGDGINEARRVVRYGGRVCLGSDANTRLCFTEEMRWLEYLQRLATLDRGVCVDETGSVARKLFQAATINGARALGLKAGAIQIGHAADFCSIDLSCLALAGWTDETLLDSFVFGTGNEAIAGTCVGGRWVEKGV